MEWSASSKGEYIVKDAVRWLTDNKEATNNNLWDKVWLKGLTPKIAFFTWLTIHNKLNTIFNLQKKGVQLPKQYCLCYEEEEIINHIFVQCSYAE